MSILESKLFNDEHALVTGAASNIGRAMALRLADDVARAAMALLSNDFMAYVTGTRLIVDGGLQLFNWIDFPSEEN